MKYDSNVLKLTDKGEKIAKKICIVEEDLFNLDSQDNDEMFGFEAQTSAADDLFSGLLGVITCFLKHLCPNKKYFLRTIRF